VPRKKAWSAASVMAISGLAAVGLAVSAAILLITGFVVIGLPAVLITVFVVLVFGLLWFAFRSPAAADSGPRGRVSPAGPG
jgi:hypothetical protein